MWGAQEKSEGAHKKNSASDATDLRSSNSDKFESLPILTATAKVHRDQVFNALEILLSLCLQIDKTNQRLGKEPHTAFLIPSMSRNLSPAKTVTKFTLTAL